MEKERRDEEGDREVAKPSKVGGEGGVCRGGWEEEEDEGGGGGGGRRVERGAEMGDVHLSLGFYCFREGGGGGGRREIGKI